MVTGWVFEIEEGHEFLVIFIDDPVLCEVLESRVQVHTSIPSEIHLILQEKCEYIMNQLKF